MEAKDTAMVNLAQAIMKHPELPMGQAISIEQAEISFKAGMEKVVSFIEVNSVHQDGLSHYCPNCDHTIIGLTPSEWQAFKEDNGLK